MAEIFPTGLQQKLNTDGFQHFPGDPTVRTQMGVGLDKVRNRYTKRIDKLNGSFHIDRSDYQTLLTFYFTTLAGGTKTFLYEDPITNTDAEFRFVGPPKSRPLGGAKLAVNFVWEYIP